MNNPTTLKYFDDPYMCESKGRLISVTTYRDKPALVLDETIFYPQGGGSPYDTGTISNNDGKFRVDEVRFEDGIVYHVGEFTDGTISEGSEVDLQVDKERRVLNCRLQTAGHLIDEAMRNLGYTDLVPTKGFHFPEGPNVEYAGEIAEGKRESLKSELETEVNRLVDKGYEVQAFFAPKEDLHKYSWSVPDYLPEGKPTRMVIVWGEKGIPCGANHVKNINEIGPITIRKIKAGGGEVKISYEL